jgi:hypothetical protein
MRVVKKRLECDALQFTEETATTVANWCGGRVRIEAKVSDPTDVAIWLEIPTLEGNMLARVGCYILKGIRGEFWPVQEDIFLETYDILDE